MNINDEVSVYFQYYQSRNTSNRNNLIFYFGNQLGGSAVKDAAFGYLPYIFYENKTAPNRVGLFFNPSSLNEYGNLVVADIVRGSGFSFSNSSTPLTFALIAQDMATFINKTLELDYVKQTAAYNIILTGGYMMTTPILTYLNMSHLNARAVISNPWLGYPTIDQTHIMLPAFGFTDRIKLDRISNQIYSF